MNNADYFSTDLALIDNDELRAKVESILNNVDERHFHEPASSTGKYHPAFAHDEGGLIRHTKAVVFITITLLSTRPDLNKDNLIAAAILHDMQKYDSSSPHTQFGHPVYMDGICSAAGIPEVGMIIKTHMGQWNTSKYSDIILPQPITSEQWLLHYADYLASRVWLNLNFDEFNDVI